MVRASMALAGVFSIAVCALACGGDGAGPTADTAQGEAEVTPLPDFTVSIDASALSGNTPLTVVFTAEVEGVESEATGSPSGLLPEALTLRWLVDDVLAGSEATLTFPFYRAGSSVVRLQADLRNEAGDVKTAEDSVTLNLLGCADLQFDRLTLEFPTDVAPGANLTVDVGRLRNEGDRIEGPFEVALALSLDERWDPAIDRLISAFEVDGMPSGLAAESAVELAGRQFALPADVVPGPYYVFLVADPGSVVNECQETNNARVSTNSIVVDPAAGQLSDLVLENLTIPEGLVVAQNENMSYSFRLRNGGEAEAKQFRYAFWISTDPILDRESDLPIVLASDENARVQSMPAGFELGFFKSWKVPDDLPDGDYWIIGEVDATGVIAESDESNNVGVTVVPFTMRYDEPECYDFGLVDLQVAPLSTYWGGSVLVTATVQNSGSQPAPDGWLLRAYLSLTQTLSAQNAILVGTYPLEGIPAGETKTYELLIGIGSDLPVIPHYLGVVIDPTGAYVECSESNNSKLFAEPIKINALAEVDVGVSDFEFHPSVVAAGEAIKVEYQLGNSGTTAATTFQVGVVLSADASITRAGIAAGDDVVVDRLTLTTLHPEEVRTLIRDVTIPAGLNHSVPEWFVAVMVDLDGFLTSDRDSTNNLIVAADRLVVTDAVGGCFEDALEDNDSLPQAALVTRDDGERLVDLGSCGDEDWYLVDVPSGVSLAVDVEARAIVSVPDTSANLIVEIREPSGAIVARATLGPSYQPRAWAVREAGEYVIRVAGATARDRAAYDLGLSFLSPVTGVEIVPFEVVPAPASAYAGGRLSVTWREVNVGTQTAAAHVGRLWLSRDRELQPGVDVMLGAMDVPTLLPQSTVDVEAVVNLAASLQPGTWYAIVEADAQGAVTEVDEANNLALGGPVVLDPLKVCNDDALEPNDEPRIATRLTGASTPTGALVPAAVVCPGLDDWYALDLELGQSADIAIDYVHEVGKGRLALELWAPDGQGALLTDARNGSARVSIPYAYRAGRWLVRVKNDESIAAQAPYTYELQATVAVGALGLACGAERYEPNDAPVGAGPIGCGTIQAELCNADVDWFVVPGLAGQRLKVQATNASSQLLVQLSLPGAGSAVATIYGAGSMEYTPAASGPLYIKVTPRFPTSGVTAFDYALTVTGIDGADLALHDMVSELDAVDRGEDVGIGFAVVNQCSLDAAPFEIGAWLSLDEVVDAGDLSVLVLQQPGLPFGESVGFRYKVTVPLSTAPGWYYLIVQADSGGDVVEGNEIDNTLWVPIEVNEPCVADRFEPNDVREDAVVVSEGAESELTICPYDADWFALSTRAGDRVTVSALFSEEDGDLDLRVYNPLVSATIPVAVSSATDDDEEVTVTTPLATTLYVRVSGYGGDSAPYDLLIESR